MSVSEEKTAAGLGNFLHDSVMLKLTQEKKA